VLSDIRKALIVTRFVRRRHRIMSPIDPPLEVRGITEWQPELFNTTALIPRLSVKSEQVGPVRKILEKYLLKIANLKPIQECDKDKARRSLLLNPDLVSSFRDLDDHVKDLTAVADIDRKHFSVHKFDLTADNWTPHEILRAILPLGEEGVSGFSIIGHILHLNLRSHLDCYKAVIGPVLLRLPGVSSVVNKSNTIDNTYRNFSMELLAGEDRFEVEVKESGCLFRFDFSKVYWNPRLGTEHDRLIRMMTASSILFDACAGVGPFAVPAAKICKVLANDLNPESYKWLSENSKSNKKSSGNIKCFNKDAREFIKAEVKTNLLDIWGDGDSGVDNAHIVMNLPALAITFVDVFHGLFSDHQEYLDRNILLPQAHIYCFSNSDNQETDVKKECEGHLGGDLDEDHFLGVNFVRNVSTNKSMYRIDFKVPKDVLFSTKPLVTGEKRSASPDNSDDVTSKKR